MSTGSLDRLGMTSARTTRFNRSVFDETQRSRYTSSGMQRFVRIAVIGIVTAVAFGRAIAADDWPYYQHDASHTGNSSALINPQMLSLAWTAPSSPVEYSTPVIV